MNGVREDLVVRLAGADTGALLEFWRWLIPESHEPLFATALGDLFLTAPGGPVLWLDVGVGQLVPVAADEAELERVAADPDNLTMWFGAALVDRLSTGGKVLKPDECYSYLQLPMLGGTYDPDNFRV
ncbi:MAG TPA: T6SS immunity protein Tdi1 domain-containing protein, partial [Gemmata sp.]